MSQCCTNGLDLRSGKASKRAQRLVRGVVSMFGVVCGEPGLDKSDGA